MQIGKNVPDDKVKIITSMVKMCVRLIRKKKYELNLPSNALNNALDVLVIKRSKKSCAGAYTISIGLDYHQFGQKIFEEYRAFRKHPTIGSIEVTSDTHILLVIVAHEIAHHIQYRYCPRIRRFKETYKKPHGQCFKDVYEYLRRDLVNQMIKDGWE